jgi:hypothetical protein
MRRMASINRRNSSKNVTTATTTWIASAVESILALIQKSEAKCFS